MRLSKNFDLSEFEESETATKWHIDNHVYDASVLKNLKALVENVLQPLRDSWGKPIHINSGYRCYRLNRVVGGVASSQHMLGQASDLRADNPYELAKRIVDLDLPYDQVILYPSFVHVSFREKNRRHKVLYNSSYKGKRL